MLCETLTFDRSLSRKDQDGHLFIDSCTLSSAVVSPYFGYEIPQANALGLHPDHVYAVYRDPEALKAAAASLNGKPLLVDHQPVNANEHPRQITVGAVNNVRFDDPNLIGDLCIWDGEAIKAISDGSRRGVSAGYTYVALPSPGIINGQSYQIKMSGIRFNHLALVEKPRVQSAVIGDKSPSSAPKEFFLMNAASLKDFAKEIASALRTDRLSKSTPEAEIIEVIKSLLPPGMCTQQKDEPTITPLKASPPSSEARACLEPEETSVSCSKAPVCTRPQPESDDTPSIPPQPVIGDASLQRVVDDAVHRAVEQERHHVKAAEAARRAVRDLVGDVIGLDSASDIYRYALEQIGYASQDVHPSALPSMVEMALDQRRPTRQKVFSPAQSDEFFKHFGITSVPRKL